MDLGCKQPGRSARSAPTPATLPSLNCRGPFGQPTAVRNDGAVAQLAALRQVRLCRSAAQPPDPIVLRASRPRQTSDGGVAGVWATSLESPAMPALCFEFLTPWCSDGEGQESSLKSKTFESLSNSDTPQDIGKTVAFGSCQFRGETKSRLADEKRVNNKGHAKIQFAQSPS